MDVLTLLASVAIGTAPGISPMSTEYSVSIPSSISFEQQPVALTVPLPTPETMIPIQPISVPLILTENPSTPTPTPNKPITPTPTSIPSPTPYKTLKKNDLKIAFLGDSMIDTLGPAISELTDELKKTYPSIQPKIYNYGVAGTNIDYGLERITHEYEYMGQKVPSLASVKPDIVVLESFAYNPYPYDEGAIEKHWLQLARTVELLKQSIPNVKIVMAATIAPNSTTFGDGKPGFSMEGKSKKVQTIRKYLESTINFATGHHIPLADAYHATQLSNKEGNLKYIHAGDNIHPSDEGRKLFSQLVAQTILKANYLE